MVINVSAEHTAFIFRVEIALDPGNSGSVFLRNVGKHIQEHMVSEYRRPQSKVKLYLCLFNVYVLGKTQEDRF